MKYISTYLSFNFISLETSRNCKIFFKELLRTHKSVVAMCFRIKSMQLYKFVFDHFAVCDIVLDINILTPNFSVRGKCRQSHPKMHTYFFKLIYRYYRYNCRITKIKKVIIVRVPEQENVILQYDYILVKNNLFPIK